jgi:hypothetical protein
MTVPPTEQTAARLPPSDTARLEAHVRSRLSGRILELRIIVHGPGLILRGLARTYYAKQLAQHVLMEVAALPIVANEIEVARLQEPPA